MPLIEVKAFAARFEDQEKSELLIEKLTEAMVAVYGDAVRDETWVTLEGVQPQHWGFGGKVRT